MRKLYWYLTAYARKHGIVFISSILFTIIIFSFIAPSIISTVENKERKYIGVVGNYTIDNLPLEITSTLSAGLTKIEEDGSPSPLISERWSVEQDGKTYRFILKEDIFWTDGKKLEPEDIIYNFNNVETIITPNDVVFKLPDSFAPFPLSVSEPILRKVDQKYNLILSRPTLIGIGVYELIDYKTNGQRISELTLEGNNERLIYRFYFTEDTANTAFKNGEIDFLNGVSSRYDTADWPNTTVKEILNTEKYLAVFFNTRTSLFSKNMRQALSYAIEKPKDKTRALGPINPASWAYLPAGKAYHKDVERGVERLMSDIPQEKIILNLTTTALYEQEAEAIKDQWIHLGEEAYKDCQENSDIADKEQCKNLKIEVNIKISNFPDTSDFELLLVGQESLPDPDQYHLWHSEQSTNFTGYSNTRIDALLEKGRQTVGQQERKEIYQEFQQFFLEDPPAIFIRHLDSYDINRN